MKRSLLILLGIGSLLLAVVPVLRADRLIVSAAASLTDAFQDMEPAFERRHPEVDLILNLASSGALYRQIEQGAPADVYAAANPRWMATAVAAGLIEPEAVDFFAGNRLVLAAPSDNPARVATLADLTGAGVLRIGIGKPETVPAGQYARSALMASGWYEALRPKFIVCEHVRQVLDYLARGEVDCGFVYRTDALKAGSSVAILQEVPLASPITYPIAVLKESPQTKMAQAFVAFVTGPEGRQLLVKRGVQ